MFGVSWSQRESHTFPMVLTLTLASRSPTRLTIGGSGVPKGRKRLEESRSGSLPRCQMRESWAAWFITEVLTLS
jgi:hypothetical protein